MGKSYWWDDGPCDFSVSPSPNWTFGFWTALVLGLGLGLGALDFRLGLDNLRAYWPFRARNRGEINSKWLHFLAPNEPKLAPNGPKFAQNGPKMPPKPVLYS